MQERWLDVACHGWKESHDKVRGATLTWLPEGGGQIVAGLEVVAGRGDGGGLHLRVVV